MRNLIIVLVVLVGAITAGVFVVAMLSRSAEQRADQSFSRVESEESFRKRYPAAVIKNESAQRLEELTSALEIDLRSSQESGGRRPTTFDGAVLDPMAEWLRKQHERDDDTIDPLPPGPRMWIDERGSAIDSVAAHLVTSDAPQWPIDHGRRRSEQPLPSLIGHVKLSRVLAVAALDAESREDHARAWTLQHGAWKLAQGLAQRPELISKMVAVANIRTIAATVRKLEAPVPAWFSELASLKLRDQLFDSVRFELTTTRNAVNEASGELLRFDDGGAITDKLSDVAMRPVFRWLASDAAAATSDEFVAMRAADPCALDVKGANARIQARMSPLSRRIAYFGVANLGSAFARAANTEIAIEGSARILALKGARDEAGGWPETFAAAPSVCRGASWVYSRPADGNPTLRLTRAVPEGDGARGTQIPAQFVAR
jgi:hypothetical protein